MNVSKFRNFFLGVAAGAVVCSGIITQTSAQESDIVDTAVAAGKFDTLVAAVKAAELVETLKGDGPFTVFAPSDDAFAKVPADQLEELLKPENKEKLQGILTYHVVGGAKVMASDVVNMTSAKTANGQEVAIAVKDGVVSIDGAKVLTTDIECSNGVIHVIDSVIMPKADIVDTAMAAGSFKTLLAAVTSDDAFAKIPAEKIAELLKPENKETLQGILTYHVVSGNVMAADVVKLTSAKTVNGKEVAIAVADGKVTVDGANVVATDIKCANGVIHVIDSVLMPK